MALKFKKPTTPPQRHVVSLDTSHLNQKLNYQKIVFGIKIQT